MSSTATSMISESWYPVHPAAIDACLQLTTVAVHEGDPAKMTKAYLPVDSEYLTFFTSAETNAYDRASGRARANFTGLRSYQGTMELVTSDGLILFQGTMATMSMEGGQGLLFGADQHQLRPYARLIWKPDIDFVTSENVNAVFSASETNAKSQLPLQDYLKSTVAKTEELAAMATLDSLQRLPPDLDLDGLPEHMGKFVRSLQKYAEDISKTEVGQLSKAERQQRINMYSDQLRDAPEAGLVSVLNRQMPEIVSGKVGALDVMLQDGLLSRLYEDGLSQRVAQVKLKGFVELIAHKDPRISILEIGSGTGGATRPVLDALNGRHVDTGGPPCYSKLTFTDVSTAFLSAAQENFKDYRNLDFKLLDIEKDPCAQEFEEETYDLIFAANVSP